MGYEEAIVEFLCQDENLGIALEVAEHLDAVKTKVERSFWTFCLETLHERLDKSRWTECWRLNRYAEEDRTGSYQGIVVQPSYVDSEQAHVYYELLQWEERSGHVLLYQAVELSSEREVSKRMSAQLDVLRNTLARHDFKVDESEVGWKPIREYESRNRLVRALAANGRELASEATEMLWDLFQQTVEQVEKINRWLKKAK